MEKLAASETLRKLALGEVDLDEISEVLRSAELVIKSYQAEVEGLRRTGERLVHDYEAEKEAVDDLTRRLAALHDENRMAREVFRTEIEGKLQLIGGGSPLDVEALNMAGLIQQREKVQQMLGKALGTNQRPNARGLLSR